MKVLDLHCRHNHAFEGWFGSEQDFQSQLQRGLLTCPLCGDAQVSKALSAPRINLGARETPAMASPQPDGAASSEVSEPAQVSMPTAASVLQWARQAAAQGIEPAGDEAAQSDGLLKLQIKALVAERLFPREGFYRVMNAADGSMFRRAVELLGAWSEQGKQILSKRK